MSEEPGRGTMPRLAPLAEVRGSMRAVLAALRNLEHLLRSPRVGPRALAQVVPGLRDLCVPLLASADEILVHLGASVESEDQAVRGLSEFVRGACGQLRQVLDWAAQASMDAKSRLSFEAQIGRLGAELTTARRLLDLLVRAAERADTELDLGEVIQESFAISSQLDGGWRQGIPVVADLPYGVHAFHASVHVMVPLVTLAIALVQRGPQQRVSVAAVRDAGQSIRISISRKPLEGESQVVHPPVLIPPVISCAEAAARVAGGVFSVYEDEVTIRWPSISLA